MKHIITKIGLIIPSLLFSLSSVVYADDKAELAKKLTNPLADIVNMPFQLNYDQNIGAEEYMDRYQLNIQPVIPIKLNDHWNLISRTIVPVVYQTYQDTPVPVQDDWGIGDITQSLFFSPAQKHPDDWMIGVGPAMLISTASLSSKAEETISSDQFALGPTAVVVKQKNGWTIGALANHLWSVRHDDDVEGISNTFLQPFLAYTTPKSWTYMLSSEATYDWNIKEASTPIIFNVSKIINIDKQLINVGAGVKYWADDTNNSPKDFGFRLTAAFIFPKK